MTRNRMHGWHGAGALMAALLLGGCVAVPGYYSGGTVSFDSPGYGYAYAPSVAYATPYPGYATPYPVYTAPSFGFGAVFGGYGDGDWHRGGWQGGDWHRGGWQGGDWHGGGDRHWQGGPGTGAPSPAFSGTRGMNRGYAAPAPQAAPPHQGRWEQTRAGQVWRP
jgi:hypothetical protein